MNCMHKHSRAIMRACVESYAPPRLEMQPSICSVLPWPRFPESVRPDVKVHILAKAHWHVDGHGLGYMRGLLSWCITLVRCHKDSKAQPARGPVPPCAHVTTLTFSRNNELAHKSHNHRNPPRPDPRSTIKNLPLSHDQAPTTTDQA